MCEARARNNDHQADKRVYGSTTCENTYNLRTWRCLNSSPYLRQYIWLINAAVLGFSNFLPDRYVQCMLVLLQYMKSGASYNKPTPRYLTFQTTSKEKCPLGKVYIKEIKL
jgi:hypothetical protein